MSQFSVKIWMGRLFSLLFITLSLLLVALAGYQFYTGLAAQKDVVGILVQSINTAIVSLAIFELGLGIGKEYAVPDEDGNTYLVIRRTITRFVATVCIALVLESLIMIIKYSQLELAGNLFYPVGILVGTSVLLISLGLFLHFTRRDGIDRPQPLMLQPRAAQYPARSRQPPVAGHRKQ